MRHACVAAAGLLGPALSILSVLGLVAGLGASPAAAASRLRALPALEDRLETALVQRAEARAEQRPEARIHAVVRVPAGSRAACEADGVRLLRSIDDDLWLASLPAGEVVRGRLPAVVRGAWDLRPADRIDRKLAESLEPGRSARGATRSVRVKVFADASFTSVREALVTSGAEILGVAPGAGVLDAVVPSGALADLIALDAVRWIEPGPPPGETANNSLRVDAHVNPPQALGIVGIGVKIGMWDESLPDTTHPDLAGRVTPGEPSLYLAHHSTHVAGIAIGDGTNSQAQGGGGLQWRGVATSASVVAWDVPGYLAEMDTAITLHDIDASNNSWRHKPNAGSCDLFGNYAAGAPEYDAIVRGLYGKAIPVMFAAGNERDDNICGLDTTGGYYSMAPPGTAKNVITVGAHQSDAGYMTYFSNWGPTDDGRMKPDLTAPGCQASGDFGITSPGLGASPGVYTTMCGTSQATPAVTGGVAMLLQEWWARFPGDPRPATSKALLGGYAMDRANPGPDYRFGLGAMNIDASVKALQTATTIEDAVDDAQLDTWTFTVAPSTDTLVVTLAWDDPPAAELADTVLVNDLDLELVGPTSGTRYPFVLDPANPSADATTGANRLDNVEQVRVLAPEAGVWTARVLGTSVPDGPQDYSLVGWDGRAPADPAGLVATALDDTTAQVTWVRPGDADRAGTLVVRSPSPIAWTPADGTVYSPGTEPVAGVRVVAADDVDRSVTPLLEDDLTPGTVWHYTLFSYDEIPNYSIGVTDTAETTSDAVHSPIAAVGPAEIRFVRTGPNPIRDRTSFRFELPTTARIALDVYDAAGRRVTPLLQGERKAGSHRVEWNGRDAAGRPVGAGMYFVRFRAPGRTFTQKVLIVR